MDGTGPGDVRAGAGPALAVNPRVNRFNWRLSSDLRGAVSSLSAVMALLVLTPLFFMIAIAIRANSKGPVLFRQLRTGLNGRKFQIYKFRSMYVQENGPVVRQAERVDHRVTAVGRFLRRSSLDELPQLLNVMRGEMAFVGPRPHALAHDDYYGQRIAAYSRRFSVKPGLTGWAQVNGSRGPTPTVESMERRVNLDIWYVENRSVWLDIRIILTTISMEISRKSDAY